MKSEQEIKEQMNSLLNPGEREILEWILNDKVRIKISDIDIIGVFDLSGVLLESAIKSESQTIVVNQNYELLGGIHALIAAALRGDTEILATLEKKS